MRNPVSTDAAGMLRERMAEARAQTDALFAMVRPEAIHARPIPERHRILFYLGHLEAFDWNLLRPRLAGLSDLDPALDRLFAFGIDPVDGGLPSDTAADWPAVAEVKRYGARIREQLDTALGRNGAAWSGDVAPATLLHTAIEHRLMHAETLAYMLHQLPYGSKFPVAQAAAPASHCERPSAIPVPAGPAAMGLAREDGEFGWDNEFDAHRVEVPAFAIDRFMVTNGQFLEFVDGGGYADRGAWTPEDWDWKEAAGVAHPLFWRRERDRWLYRGMAEEIPLPLDWPVYVSHAEARAYARRAGKRLPTEAEWQRAAYGDSRGAAHAYVDFRRWDPAPVDAMPQARSAFGLEGMSANGWEWTASEFAPFAGFRPFPFYPGYSADFFDGRHFVIKGGSMRTDKSMLRPSFRNWFQPHYQYAYAGFRCVSC